MNVLNTAKLYWDDIHAKNFPDFMIASEEAIEHPTTHMQGALLRNMKTLTYTFFCGSMYAIPQDYADTYATAFKDELKTWRLQTGMTQAEASEILMVPLRTLVNWERGVRRPPYYTKKMIVEKYQSIWKSRQKTFTAEPWRSLKGFLEAMAEKWNEESEQKIADLLQLADAPAIIWRTHTSQDVLNYIRENF